MKKVLVVYATRSGKTMVLGEYIANGIRTAGIQADLVSADSITDETSFNNYDAYIFGSATKVGDMLPEMKSVLKIAEKAGLQGKKGGAFGTFGCSGEGPIQIYDTMKSHLDMDMVTSGLLIMESNTPVEMIGMGKEYGGKVAEKLI